MKLTIEPSVFRNALKTIAPSISSNTVIPILENIRCNFIENKMEIRGTNLNLTICVDVVCKSKDEGVFLLPFKKINGIVGLAEYPIEITIDKKIEIKIGREKFNFGIPVDSINYPSLNEGEYLETFPVSSDFISNLKSSTKFTTTDKSGFDPLRNVCIDLKGNETAIISTDRNGFFYYSDNIETKNKLTVTTDSVFINSLPLIEDGEISLSERTIRLSNESVRIIATLSEHKFFNYSPALTEHTANCLINRVALLDSLNQIVNLKVETSVISISFKKDFMKIDFSEPEYDNDYTNTIPCDHSVELDSIMLGAVILRNLIQSIPQEEKIRLTFKDEKTQVYLDSEDGKNMCFIAPVVYINN